MEEKKENIYDKDKQILTNDQSTAEVYSNNESEKMEEIKLNNKKEDKNNPNNMKDNNLTSEIQNKEESNLNTFSSAQKSKTEQCLPNEIKEEEKKIENTSGYKNKSNDANSKIQLNDISNIANIESINNNEKENDVFSPEKFKKLYNKLHSIATESKKLDKLKNDFTTLIESVTEFLIHGDKKDPEIFELFSSLNFIHDLILIMKQKNKDINIQIIKFFSVLMTNLSEKHILYFIFNCDFINQHVFEDNEPIEGDYLYYYISFIKSLILKINVKTISVFYHSQSYTFPLLGNCLKFYNHPDSMISNTIRNVLLFIMKINYPQSIEYICNLPMLTYFIFIACRLRDEIKTLHKKLKRNKEEDCMILHEQIISDIMYFQDMFSIGIDKINFILINSIFHFIILPVICNSIIYSSDLDASMNNSREGGPNDPFGTFLKNNFNININNINKNSNEKENPLLKHCISPELALYILNIFLKYIKNDSFLNLLISLIFLPKIHHKIITKLKTPIKDLDNYQGDYNNKARKKIDFVKYITQNFNHTFIKAQINFPIKTFSELKKIEKKLTEKLMDYNIPYNLSQPVPFGFLMELLNGYFSSKEIKECREYHEIVSESTGIQCGLTYRSDRKCFMYLMQKNLAYIKNDYSFEKAEIKFIDNEVYTSFLNSYKDCNDLFLILSNYLYLQIINNEFISKELLAYIKLLTPKEVNKNILNNIAEEDSPVLQLGALIGSRDKKIKKKLEEPLTFSNLFKAQYKKDFILKEFNLYNNEILSKSFYNGQLEYNSKLFGDVISYINRDGILKPETYLFIIKLINELIIYEDNNEVKFLKLRNIHKSIIKNAFAKNIEQIKNIINDVEIEVNELKMIYIFLWGSNRKMDIFQDYERCVNNIMKDCLFLSSKNDNNDGNIIPGIELYNNLIIENKDLKTRIYFLKGILYIYYLINEIKENDIQMIELNDSNIDNVKNVIVENLNKLIEKEKNNS